jgi:hypothetical protein
MSTRLQVSALTVLLAFAAIAPGPALAKRMTASHHHARTYAYQPNPSGTRPSAAAPGISASRSGRWLETDPDSRIRFEMNRDNFDHRLGGN